MSALSDRLVSSKHDIYSTDNFLMSSQWVDVIRTPRSRPDAIIAASLIRAFQRRLPFRLSQVPRSALRSVDQNMPTIILHRPRALYRRLAKDGLIGLGESYQAGDWDCDDLVGLLTIFASHLDELVPPGLNWIRRFHGPRRGRQSPDALADTRRDISHHYDLPDELFNLFLDQTMTYSCALFETDSTGHPIASADSLQAAQERKIDRLLDLAHVRDGSRVLEIGTGWGELAARAAERGAHVLSVTLSAAQQ